MNCTSFVYDEQKHDPPRRFDVVTKRFCPSSTYSNQRSSTPGSRDSGLGSGGQYAQRLLGVFGQEGGIRAGTPGVVAVDKLLRPAGADFDAAGNLYVGMRYDEKPGGCILRRYDPKGALRWEQACPLFSEAWDIDGDAAGNLTARSFRPTFSKPAGATRGDWHWDALTLDSAVERRWSGLATGRRSMTN